MFDWNDEELTNIIWGDGGESDDHIVPYPDQIEEKPAVLYGKESNHQSSTIISPLEPKKHTAKPESDDSTRASASNGKSTSPKKSSVPDEMAQLDKDSGIFENPAEEREDGDFVDYGWANIGSFDDLDRIFSNNDPIFGDLSVGNAEELWPSSKDGNRKKKFAKGEEASKKSERKAWAKPFQQINSVYSSQITHQQIPVASPLYGSNMMNQYLPTQFHPLDRKDHERADVLPAMTPKEKIEKLRRRQQMRAIMAIQKQQLHFKKQASQHSKVAAAVENYHSVVENYSVEESVLYRVQDHISKMDMRIRLCIRDSLYRLAQSAMWRQYPNEMSSGSGSTCSRDELGSNKDSNGHERFTRMPDVETDTNPIDRAVAHLLFHQPIEFSGKPAETPESPLSGNHIKKASPIKSLGKGYFPESAENNTHITSPLEPKPPTAIFPQGDESQNNLCFVTSKNAMNNESTDVVQMNDEKSSK
ncbi:Unknown protein [Striga hermonthica]|uniref:Protein LNK2 n=1 Tax=Striga hermonthica TaxID=68872 RepID=A0A9N7MNZ3_STRHE|nr:Unknown protein [Striga hermonthica]